MLARRSWLRFADGTEVRTPLLVPSFTSRGFGTKRGRSNIRDYLRYAETFLHDSALISAYDLHYGHLPAVSAIGRYPAKLPYSAPTVLFIDSGTYESRSDVDALEGRLVADQARPWNPTLHAKTVETLVHERLPVVMVNYDRCEPMPRQIARARQTRERFPTFVHDFLIKPERRREAITADRVLESSVDLVGFGVIGFTEKELGSTLLDRLKSLARIRQGLDGAGVLAPIHVFGSLDPLLSPLYFLAGAEIFDGPAWLYLAANESLWIYGDERTALLRQWTFHDRQRWATRLQSNLASLEDLQAGLARFLASAGADWASLGRHHDLFREAFEHLMSELEA